MLSPAEVTQHYERECIAMRGKSPGTVRAMKGKLVEDLTKHMVELAWRDLGGAPRDLTFAKGKHYIPINREYVGRQPQEIREYIESRIDEYRYGLGCDVQVHVRGAFFLAIECKSFTENAMLKRILIDCSMLKSLFPDLRFALVQLESMLGGDYSDLGEIRFGSVASHTIMSYFDVDLTILTMLQGERRINQPVHEARWYKPLTQETVASALSELQVLLVDAVSR